MIAVPDDFFVSEKHIYPHGNNPSFEEWFMRQSPGIINGREYIAVLWTAYYKNHSYGKDKAAIERLQGWINQLPTDKKYFTVVQYDDGILNDLSRLDCMIFSMSGKPENSIPIPLVCQPHKFSFPEVERDILCSFIGRVTDPIRQELIDWGLGRKDCYITSANHPPKDYCKILARSKFVLCPRGYGASSFRTAEALQYGAMPFLFGRPGDRIFETKVLLFYKTYGDWYSPDHHHDMEKFMRETDVPDMQIKATYRMFYTFQGVRAYIIQNLTSGN